MHTRNEHQGDAPDREDDSGVEHSHHVHQRESAVARELPLMTTEPSKQSMWVTHRDPHDDLASTAKSRREAFDVLGRRRRGSW